MRARCPTLGVPRPLPLSRRYPLDTGVIWQPVGGDRSSTTADDSGRPRIKHLRLADSIPAASPSSPRTNR